MSRAYPRLVAQIGADRINRVWDAWCGDLNPSTAHKTSAFVAITQAELSVSLKTARDYTAALFWHFLNLPGCDFIRYGAGRYGWREMDWIKSE